MTTMTDDKVTELRALAGYLRGNADWYGEDEESPGPDCDRWWRLVESLIPLVESSEELPTAVIVSNQAEDTWSLACPECDGNVQMVEKGIEQSRQVTEWHPATKEVHVNFTETYYDGAYTDHWECRICLTEVALPKGADEVYDG